MLQIKNLTACLKTTQKQLISDINIEAHPKDIHLIIGPNGAGKSSFAKAMMGSPDLEVTGSIILDDRELINEPTDSRARAGLFLAHQAPPEIPGVRLTEFLRLAYNNLQEDPKDKLDPWSFHDIFNVYLKDLNIPAEFAERMLNEGFSGGEKKKSEVLQMLILQPRVSILDEIDSGLDLDSQKIIFKAISEYTVEKGSITFIITHNPNILKYIIPTKVHLLVDTKLKETGDVSLFNRVSDEGFKNIF